jgi:hypothetical protein
MVFAGEVTLFISCNPVGREALKAVKGKYLVFTAHVRQMVAFIVITTSFYAKLEPNAILAYYISVN